MIRQGALDTCAVVLRGLLLVVAGAVACGAVGAPVAAADESGISLTEPERAWGIRVLGVHRSAAGYVLDFRYRVIDPTRARPLLERSVRPILIDETSGRTLVVPSPPKVGSLRTSGVPETGRSYFVLFGNPGKLVEKGGRVTVVMGDLRLSHLRVE